MERAVIFGVNDFSELLYTHLKKSPNHPPIEAFIVHRKYLRAHTHCGLPVLALESFVESHPVTLVGVYVCVGYNGMNSGRRAVYKQLQDVGYSILSYLHPSAQVDAEHIGRGTIAFQNVMVDAKCVVGDGNIFYAGALLAHHSTMGDFNFMAVNSCIAGHVRVGCNCFFGAHSTVRDGIAIADETLVGAGAYAFQSTWPGAVVVPAKGVLLPGKTSRDFL